MQMKKLEKNEKGNIKKKRPKFDRSPQLKLKAKIFDLTSITEKNIKKEDKIDVNFMFKTEQRHYFRSRGFKKNLNHGLIPPDCQVVKLRISKSMYKKNIINNDNHYLDKKSSELNEKYKFLAQVLFNIFKIFDIVKIKKMKSIKIWIDSWQYDICHEYEIFKFLLRFYSAYVATLFMTILEKHRINVLGKNKDGIRILFLKYIGPKLDKFWFLKNYYNEEEIMKFYYDKKKRKLVKYFFNIILLQPVNCTSLEGSEKVWVNDMKKPRKFYSHFVIAFLSRYIVEKLTAEELGKCSKLRRNLLKYSPRCGNCGHKSRILKECSNCHQARYCDRECQKKHYKEHKKSCYYFKLSSSCGNCGIKAKTKFSVCGNCSGIAYCSKSMFFFSSNV